MARIGFVGLGNMGLPMAQNLLKAGHQVEGVDVNPASVARLVAAGGVSVETAKSAAAPFDLILTDVVLGAEDGIATLDTLRAAHPSASVIVMSGYSPTPERVAELARQGAEFLPKPFGAVQLMAALDRARSAAS